MKTCTKCNELKPLDEFHRQASKKSDGRKAQCKSCGCARARAFYFENREHYLDYAKVYVKRPGVRTRININRKLRHVKDPRRQILMHAKSRARRLGLPFDIDLDDILIPVRCPALGIEIVAGGSKRQKDCSPTIDRVIPQRGYVRGNVAVISWRANRLKSDANIADLEGVLAYYRSALAVGLTAAQSACHNALEAAA